jgi:hypothetical protein
LGWGHPQIPAAVELGGGDMGGVGDLITVGEGLPGSAVLRKKRR